MVAEGKLDKDSAGLLVIIESSDQIDNLVGGGFDGDLDVVKFDSCLCRGLRLHANIGGRVRTFASLDNRQLRLEPGELGLDGLDL